MTLYLKNGHISYAAPSAAERKRDLFLKKWRFRHTTISVYQDYLWWKLMIEKDLKMKLVQGNSGGGKGNRTHDLLNAIQAHHQWYQILTLLFRLPDSGLSRDYMGLRWKTKFGTKNCGISSQMAPILFWRGTTIQSPLFTGMKHAESQTNSNQVERPLHIPNCCFQTDTADITAFPLRSCLQPIPSQILRGFVA